MHLKANNLPIINQSPPPSSNHYHHHQELINSLPSKKQFSSSSVVTQIRNLNINSGMANFHQESITSQVAGVSSLETRSNFTTQIKKSFAVAATTTILKESSSSSSSHLAPPSDKLSTDSDVPIQKYPMEAKTSLSDPSSTSSSLVQLKQQTQVPVHSNILKKCWGGPLQIQNLLKFKKSPPSSSSTKQQKSPAAADDMHFQNPSKSKIKFGSKSSKFKIPFLSSNPLKLKRNSSPSREEKNGGKQAECSSHLLQTTTTKSASQLPSNLKKLKPANHSTHIMPTTLQRPWQRTCAAAEQEKEPPIHFQQSSPHRNSPAKKARDIASQSNNNNPLQGSTSVAYSAHNECPCHNFQSSSKFVQQQQQQQSESKNVNTPLNQLQNTPRKSNTVDPYVPMEPVQVH